jgi:methylenetetrahydrofolate dehydrogenase (NADP+)/methenyltetrahydrofolate cyclohydrolase
MSAIVIDGKRVAADVRAEVRARAEALIARGVRPGLTVVLVGDDPASAVYVKSKDKAAQEALFQVRTLKLAAKTTQTDLESVVRAQSADPTVHGILVQMPLPGHLDAAPVIELIDPRKDVDGLTSTNVAALAMGRAGHRPCTPAGCIELLDRHGIALEGASVVVLGRSMLVGKPFALLALARNATVTIAHSKSRDLPSIARAADILLAAVGKPGFVRGDWIKPGATVIDVGINRLPDGKLVGDVDFEAASVRAGAITPVPGGVGPMTIAMLLQNTLRAAQRLSGNESPATKRPGTSGIPGTSGTASAPSAPGGPGVIGAR